ncbi:MAG TPA: diacylglycerol kinase family protein, partial [Acidimicrobiales bacterium]|nr:diacylglycerol kinase family protein [Acidimicrobiales bacterium]
MATDERPGARGPRPPGRSRLAAGAAILVALATLVIGVVYTVQNLLYVLAALVADGLAVSALWVAATNRRFRWWAAAAAVLLVAGSVASLVAAGRGLAALGVVVVGIALSAALGTLALRYEVGAALDERWRPVPATRHGVLLVNPKSGDGKAERFKLADDARRRGIEVVVLERGDDLLALAEAAVARGADALGMAGGDGSQALVASVAAAHGLPFVCIPAGTRNHFALDLGIDRDDPRRALGAFGAARQSTVDLGEVNGQVFVNNVSLGVYAEIVASDQYREAKQKTVARMLPDLLGPDAPAYGLAVDRPGGRLEGLQLVQVSNNPYTLSSLSGFGSRARMDAGVLGVAAVSVTRAASVTQLVALEVAGHPERFEGWHEWTTEHLEVDGPNPMPAAVDGEARSWTPPLRFSIRRGVLEVRIAPSERGASPAFTRTPLVASTLVGLARLVAGRPSGMVPGPVAP